MRHHAYGFLCRIPVGVRLATGFLLAGLVAVLAAGFVGLLPAQAPDDAASLQGQLSAANAELTTALVLLQTNDSSVHLALEDAASGQPSSVLLNDQAVAQGLAAQYEGEMTTFVRDNLLAQQSALKGWLIGLGQGDAVEQQRGLVISVTYTWQRYHAAQTQVLQDLLAGQFHAAQMLARFQSDPLETDVLSALYSLTQFQGDLALSAQRAARMQALHNQQAFTLLGVSMALVLILIVGLLVSVSVVAPLRRLQQVIHAVAAGENEARVAVIGRDEVADISSRVNDLLTSIDGLLAEVSRQHHGQVSAAELLFAVISGGDANAVHGQVAEVGDPLKVLDAVCRDVIAHFQNVSSSAQAAAQQLEAIALRTQSQAEAALLDQQGTPVEFARELLATVQQLEALSGALAAALPDLRESAA